MKNMSKNKTWGGRFNKPQDPLVKEFNSSLLFDRHLYMYDLIGSIGHAEMLAKQCLISKEEGKIIVGELKKMLHEFQEGKQIAVDFDAEDVHMFVEQMLIARVGEVGKKLHTGRSRNDQVATDLRLFSRSAWDTIDNLFTDFIELLSGLADKHKNDIMPGYTHLQQAQPITLGNYFGAYLDMFNRDQERLGDWGNRMNYSPLGAGALAGSNLPLDREFVAEELGFHGIIANTIDAVSDRDFVIEFLSMASITMVHLSRMCEDLILWSTTEFNYVQLDDAFATGSSLMPNKKNPDVLELIRGKSGRVFGHLMGMLTVMKGLPLAYNKDMQEDKQGYFDAIDTLVQCLEIIVPFLNSLKFNTELMKKRAGENFLDATAQVEKLVLEGMPFRDAHHKVGEMVAAAIEEGKTGF